MYAYLKGEIAEIEEDNLVLEVNGIGYNVKVPSSVSMQFPCVGDEIKVYTYTCVREDAFILYGFLSKEDLAIFKLLITVSGIGPKGALGILSIMSASDLRFAIMASDAKTISRAPGIGAKSAERIIIDLKDKVNVFSNEMGSIEPVKKKVKEKKTTTKTKEFKQESLLEQNIQARNDAIEALVALGYSAADALKGIKSIGNLNGMDAEEILKAALKTMI